MFIVTNDCFNYDNREEYDTITKTFERREEAEQYILKEIKSLWDYDKESFEWSSDIKTYYIEPWKAYAVFDDFDSTYIWRIMES